MIINVNDVVPEVAEGVRGGIGTVTAHKLLDLFPGSAIKSIGIVRLEPGASVGEHSHHDGNDTAIGNTLHKDIGYSSERY